MEFTDEQIERFWSHVDKSGDCWVWLAARKQGRCRYGFFHKVHGKMLRAHRVAWKLANGPIPDGLCVLHKCDNPPCVNPDHLFLGTQQDNVADRDAKGRQAKGLPHYENRRRGEEHHKAKLTWKMVREMRRLHSTGVSTTILMGQFGVSRSMINNIVRGLFWKEVA